MTTWSEKRTTLVEAARILFSDEEGLNLRQQSVYILGSVASKHKPGTPAAEQDAAAIQSDMLKMLTDAYNNGATIGIMGHILSRLVRRGRAKEIGEAVVDAAAINLLKYPGDLETLETFFSALIEYGQVQLVIDRAFENIIKLWQEGGEAGHRTAQKLLDKLLEKDKTGFVKERMFALAVDMAKNGNDAVREQGKKLIAGCGIETVLHLWQSDDPKNQQIAQHAIDTLLEENKFNTEKFTLITAHLLGAAVEFSKNKDDPEKARRGQEMLEVLHNKAGLIVIESTKQANNRLSLVRRRDELLAYGGERKHELGSVPYIFSVWKTAAKTSGPRFWRTVTPDSDVVNLLQMVRAGNALAARRDREVFRPAIEAAKDFGLWGKVPKP